jgi:hypothetical protein
MSASWERQPGETEAAYVAFCSYRDLGAERSLNAAYSTDGKRAPGQWAKWSAQNQWVARAEAYDDYLEGEVRRLRERSWVRMQAHLDHRRRMFEFGHQERLEGLVDKMLETAQKAMDATIRACMPPDPPAEEPADPLLAALNLDPDGNPIPPPPPPKPVNVKVNISGLGRFTDSLRAAAREAALGLVLVKPAEPAAAGTPTVMNGAEIAWVKPQSDPDPDEK